MDIISLYQDYGLDFKTEGHKHCRPGFVNVECPFCSGNPGYHLSFHLENERFMCWRCGTHWPNETVAKLLNVSIKEAESILKNYGDVAIRVKTPTKKIQTKAFRLPSNTGELKQQHIKYLEERGFDPEKLIADWNLLGTLQFSKLPTKPRPLDFRFRIIIPYMWDDEIVTFDSRDITKLHPIKYIACPIEREIMGRKDILYCNQNKLKKTGILVEGPTDVWRFGTNAFACSGIKYTPKQLRLISKMFDRVAVCFDGPSETSDELQAKQSALDMVGELKFRGVDAFRVEIKGDPGSMKQNEADYLVKQLIK